MQNTNTLFFLLSHTHDNKECDEHKKLIKQKNTYRISRFNQSSSRTSPKKSIVKNIYLTHTKWNKMKIKRTKTFLAVAARCFNSGATVSQHFASIGRNRKKNINNKYNLKKRFNSSSYKLKKKSKTTFLKHLKPCLFERATHSVYKSSFNDDWRAQSETAIYGVNYCFLKIKFTYLFQP